MTSAALESRISELRDQHDCIAKLIANGETVQKSAFLSDVRRKLIQYGRLTPKQIEAVSRSFDREQQYQLRREAIAAQQLELKARGVRAPEGHHSVTGEIVAVKQTPFGHGVVVRSVEGFAVWLNVPVSLRRSVDNIESVRGRKVEFTATLERSDRDPLFAFAKRPSNATFID